METESFAEGLFLKNYLGTVSTVPKSRPPNQSDTKFTINSFCGEEYRTCPSHSMKSRMPGSSKASQYLKEKNADELDIYKTEHNGIDSPNTFVRRNMTYLNQPEYEKKKGKKWTLGVLFRKKCKKIADDITDESEEEVKKNVSHPKCKKEKIKSKVKSTSSGFDKIIPSKKEEIQTSKYESSHMSEQNDSNIIYQKSVGNSAVFKSDTPTRFIHRHQNNFSEDEKIKCSQVCLQVSKNIRQNSSATHNSSVSGENTEGRKCRKKVLARAEAKRDMICDDSSSEDYEYFYSNSSPSKNNFDQSGARKLRRNKRLSRNGSYSPKSSDSFGFGKENDLTLVRSNVQESIQFNPSLNQNTLYYSVDQGDEKLSTKKDSKIVNAIRNHSQKHRTFDPMKSCQANTLPFVHSLQKNQNSYTSFLNLPVKNKIVSTMQNQSLENQTCISYSFQEDQSFISNMQSTHLGYSQGSLNATVNSENTKLSGTDPSFSTSAREKNWLSIQDICKTNFLKNCDTERFLDQLLNECNQINQISINSLPKSRFPLLNFEQSEELEIFEKKTNENEIEDDFYFCSNVPSTYESRIKSKGNKASPYVSTPMCNITNQPTKTLQRSGNEYFYDDSELSGNFEQNHSSSYQNIPTCTHTQNKNPNKENETQTQNRMFSRNPNLHSFESHNGFSPMSNNLSNENGAKESSSVLRYYADLNPRSRNPIHITCCPAAVSHEPLFSCTQAASKPKDSYFSKQSEFSDSTILKMKDQEIELRDFATHQENFQDTYRPYKTNGNLKLNRSRLNSLKSDKATNTFNQPFAHGDSNNLCESQNQFKNFCVKHDVRENFKDKTKPFEPPIETFTQQEIRIPVNKSEQLESENNKINREAEFKNCSSNLSDALDELENIYNGLKNKNFAIKSISCEKKCLSDENLGNVNQKREESINSNSENLPVGKEFLNFSTEESNISPPVNKPDKIYDDMAFRRMNVKDRSNAKTFISPSYLRFSFTSPQLIAGSPTFQKKSSSHLKEPDVTYDDMVFRNIRRANNTLKVLDPQPPFGIPLGIFTPAPCSNYLDAVPKERFRSTFSSSKIPDIVKDDLAFRNLRKDNKSVSNLSRKEFSKSDANLLKKRAIRSLSANISNIMHTKDSLGGSVQTNGSALIKKKEEKSLSLTNLPNGYLYEKEISAKRLKNEKNNNEFFEKFAEIKNKIEGNKKESISYFKQSKSIEEIKNFDLNAISVINKSSNSNSIKKSNFVFAPKRYTEETVDKKYARFPIVALSKYPAAAPVSENTDRENSFDFFYNENKLQNLISVLNDEFTVSDSERLLNNLEWKPVTENKIITTAIEGFNEKLRTEFLEKVKRRRNLSLSNMNESKLDDNWAVRSSSLERRKWPTKKDESLLHFDDLSGSTKNVNGLSFKEKESNSMGASKNLGETLNEEALAEETTGYNASQTRASATKNHFTSDSSIKLGTKELKLNSPLELESNEICSADMKKCVCMEKPATAFVKLEVPFELGDTFQEVYEYNCQLTDKRDSEFGKKLIGNKNEKSVAAIEASNYKFEGNSLTEQKFEKLHKEQSNCIKNTIGNKEQLSEFADGESLKESNLFLPLNAERCNSSKLKNRGGTSEFSSKGEGEAKKDNLKTNLWLACTYALAFAFHFQQIDFLIALGTVLAVILVIAILIL